MSSKRERDDFTNSPRRYAGLGIEPATAPSVYRLVIAQSPFNIEESTDLDALLEHQRILGARGVLAWIHEGSIVVSAPGGHKGVGPSQAEEIAMYEGWFE